MIKIINIITNICIYKNVHMKYKVYYYRIDVSEGININETNASEEFILCHY